MNSALRPEQNMFIAKQIILGDIIEFSDKYLTFSDKVKEVARESNINEKYLLEWALGELGVEMGNDE